MFHETWQGVGVSQRSASTGCIAWALGAGAWGCEAWTRSWGEGISILVWSLVEFEVFRDVERVVG